MPRIPSVQPEQAEGKVKELFDQIQSHLGMVPNIMKVFGNSSAVLEAYLGFSKALQGGLLSAQLREKIALAISQENQCNYCLAAHSAIGAMTGLDEKAILDSRKGISDNQKDQAAITFSRSILEKKGFVSDKDVDHVRDAGWNDGEIVEMIANVSLNLFTNYFNHVVEPEIDFPAAPELS